MIKITSIEIDGFIVPSQKVKLDFVESNIVCIYGNNGSGKTTFLEILFAVFDRDEEILKKHNVKKVMITTLKEESPYIIEKIENTEKWQNILLQEIDNINSDIDIDTYVRDMKSQYYWSQIDDSTFNNVSSLFLGIGRGIHKKELKIPRNTLWHFFNKNRRINEDKGLTGNEIDDFTDKLVEYLMSKNKNDINSVEADTVKFLDDKKNIYLPHIDIDTLEALLNSKYKDAVTNAKNKIEKVLSKTSLNFLNPQSHIEKNIDLNELRDKLIYNKSLLLEMFTDNENMGIVSTFKTT
jgi:energy-coupling factor transporter ATP-binding protein EcfA2